MKKSRLTTFTVLAGVTVLFTACGGGLNEAAEDMENENSNNEEENNLGGEENDSEGEVVEEPGVLNWQAIPPYSLQATDEERVEYLESAISEWEEENEGMEVNPMVTTSNISEGMARLQEQASQGRAPDVAMIDSYIFPRFYDYLQPLDPFMEEAGLTIDDFFPFAQEVMTGPDGNVYGIQFTTDVRNLYYNTELVPEPPESWEEVLEIGQELSEDGYDAFMFPGGTDEPTVNTSLWPYFWAQGGELVDEDGEPVFGEGENREIMLETLEYLEELVDSGVTPTRVTTYGNEADLNAEIAGGNLGMFIGGNWQVAQMREILGDDADKWDVAPIPHKDPEDQTTLAGGWVWGIFAEDEEKQQAAFDFITHTFVEDEGMGEWATIGGYLPTRESLYDSEHYEGGEFSDEFSEFLNHAEMRPAAESYTSISAELSNAVSSVLSGSSSPEDALDDAWESVQ
ncbi:extracellular solute-binding protein [Alkalicoccus saliphilus]|uniref:ABC transporter substrate-binding protein n=1 Tax=Alkalicoccus saliphilus TaxID=200989 RepID=A0A2T4U6T6_9BACI|nr:extracellular solute-binding protein [Alkalicoccus saliphilus]PTL39110.1 hypothetical protein C6Y45_07990 [Alkalicoccus saliphilus]